MQLSVTEIRRLGRQLRDLEAVASDFRRLVREFTGCGCQPSEAGR